jgi:hypothetical protein
MIGIPNALNMSFEKLSQVDTTLYPYTPNKQILNKTFEQYTAIDLIYLARIITNTPHQNHETNTNHLRELMMHEAESIFYQYRDWYIDKFNIGVVGLIGDYSLIVFKLAIAFTIAIFIFYMLTSITDNCNVICCCLI